MRPHGQRHHPKEQPSYLPRTALLDFGSVPMAVLSSPVRKGVPGLQKERPVGLRSWDCQARTHMATTRMANTVARQLLHKVELARLQCSSSTLAMRVSLDSIPGPHAHQQVTLPLDQGYSPWLYGLKSTAVCTPSTSRSTPQHSPSMP